MFNKILKRLGKHFQVRRYAYEFPYYIAREYSAKEKYSVSEIESIITKYNFSGEFNYYGHALFITEDEYNNLFIHADSVESYDVCRRKVSKILKINKRSFGFHELITRSRYPGAITITKDDEGNFVYSIADFLDSSAMGGH
tara:strand:+ start:1435 stop:1857 length:423 start_codon:yes stop_codon:yes gene_type:complete